jgi:hypothetical protein
MSLEKKVRFNPWWNLLETISERYGKDAIKKFAEYSQIEDYNELVRLKAIYSNSRNKPQQKHLSQELLSETYK